ncbi:unnamed protein product [Linum trigynum]|uniref:Uncharacterized protein n=1 Tax=Linum trigynum TaxID=586398 RepID=A0AAV2GNM4_9ROSI
MFVYTEAVEGIGVILETGKHLVSMVEVNYMEIILTKVTMILIPTFSTKSKVKVIINLSHHMKKKSNGAMPTNPSTASIQVAVVFTTTIMELMKVHFMIWIIWKIPCQHQLVTPVMKKKGAMLVQTALTLLKVLMIQEAQSQTQMMMRCLVTMYLYRTTLTFWTTIGVSTATWGRQRSQYGVHSLVSTYYLIFIIINSLFLEPLVHFFAKVGQRFGEF